MIYRNLILTTILSLFYITNVYGAKGKKSKGNDIEASTSTATESRPNLQTGNTKEEVIKIKSNFSYKHRIDNPDDKAGKVINDDGKIIQFSYYSHGLSQVNKDKIEKSLDIKQLEFNEKVFIFDEKEKLPDRKTWKYFRVFSCKHCLPVMIRIKTVEDDKPYHYYYAVAGANNTLKNIEIDSLDEQAETDANGLIRHEGREDIKSEEYSAKISQVWPKIFDAVCQGHSNNKFNSSTLKITIISPDEQTNEKAKNIKK